MLLLRRVIAQDQLADWTLVIKHEQIYMCRSARIIDAAQLPFLPHAKGPDASGPMKGVLKSRAGQHKNLSQLRSSLCPKQVLPHAKRPGCIGAHEGSP